jgi:hypothetical protein
MLPLVHWPSLEIPIIETERRAGVRPTCSIFGQKEQWIELSSTAGQAGGREYGESMG